MKKPVKRVVFWTPRILCILFAVFVSLFALDVFGEGYDFWETIVALVMHLIPTGIILISLAIAWRRRDSVRGHRSRVRDRGLGQVRVDHVPVDSWAVVLGRRSVPGQLALPRGASVERLISVLWLPHNQRLHPIALHTCKSAASRAFMLVLQQRL